MKVKVLVNYHSELRLAPLVSLTDLDLQILPPQNRITADELGRRLQGLDLDAGSNHRLVDVRSEAEFHMCRIDGAVNYPLEKFHGAKIAEVLGMVEGGDQVTFVCRRGNDSQVAANTVLDLLDDVHKSRVKDLVGGLHSWSGCVDRDFPVY
ncbi:unnamed protein product, partial [Iphiclides podalirius]